MGFLANKKILVTGLLSNRSIAYGIAKALQREGAQLAFTYAGEGIRERVQKLAADFNVDIVLPCDVSSDDDISNLFLELAASTQLCTARARVFNHFCFTRHNWTAR